MTIHIVGLGPAGAGMITQESARLLAGGSAVVLHTRRHPAVAGLEGSASFRDCDDILDSAPGIAGACAQIAERVLNEAQNAEVVFALPGNPLSSHDVIAALSAGAQAKGIDLEIHPALGSADFFAAQLGIDSANIQVCPADSLRIDPQRPAIVGPVRDQASADQLKRALLAVYPPEQEVVHLSATSAGRQPRRTPLSDLEPRLIERFDFLFLPAVDAVHDVRRPDGLVQIVARLQAPDGCPWDREQTHLSLRHHLLEETYECLEAIDSGDPAQLVEELGDVLLQVLMHAAVAERSGEFSLGDVTERISRKLIQRHPHVFGGAEVASADEAWRNWDTLKRKEKPSRSILEGVPASLPALAASQAIQSRARRAGFDWPDIAGPLEKLSEEAEELARAESDGERAEEFGDVLFVLANISDRLGIDAEQALRGANNKFRLRFARVEELATERGLDLAELDLAGLDRLWDEAKRNLAGS